MNEVPKGLVRVCLASRRDSPPFAEFHLAESELAGRLHRYNGRAATFAHEAAETAWSLTQLTTEEAREAAQERLLSPETVAQVEALRAAGQPAMGVGDYAEVTGASGARSVWCCAPVGWELVERQSANMAARMRAQRQAQQHGEAAIEAER